MRSFMTTKYSILMMGGRWCWIALVLSPALPGAVAVGVRPATGPTFEAQDFAFPLSSDSTGPGLSDFVSSISSMFMPSKKPVRVVRAAASSDVKDQFRGKIGEVKPRGAGNIDQKITSIDQSMGDFTKFKGSRLGRWPSAEANTQIVSGWVLVHGLGNHTNVVQQPQLSKLTRAVRDSVANALDTCRHSVFITEARSINVKLIDESLQRMSKPSSLMDRTKSSFDWLMGRRQSHQSSQVNLTQVKIWYEVRIFNEIRSTQDDIATRVDALQIYGRFADAGKQLSQSFIRTDVDFGPIIVLDDLGYASRDSLHRPPLDKDARLDCVEEMLLRDARVFHEYAVAAALLVAAFTACAGSAVFGLKKHSHVPSRFNMLSRDIGSVS
jgi:hypothetical protein